MKLELRIKSYIEDVIRKSKLSEICGFDVIIPNMSSEHEYMVVLYYSDKSKIGQKTNKLTIKERIYDYLGIEVDVLVKYIPEICEKNKKGQE
jgi:hypothetical protein